MLRHSRPRTKGIIHRDLKPANIALTGLTGMHCQKICRHPSARSYGAGRPFPNVDSGRWQVSTSGGTRPRWAPSGRELFYLDGDGLLTAVPVQTAGPTFRAGTPARILNTRYYAGSSVRGLDLRGYDVSPDGLRFLMIKHSTPSGQTQNAPPTSMVVVLNWFEELKQRVGGE